MTRTQKINKAFKTLRNLEADRISLNAVGSIEECSRMDKRVIRAEKKIDRLILGYV